MRYLLSLLIPVMLMACHKSNESDQGGGKKANEDAYCGQCRPSRWHAGEVDDQGRLVVFEASGLSKTLASDYALAFLNTGGNENPVAQYNLSSRESGYESFKTLDALLERIRRIPLPRIIDFYGTCGAPPYYGLPDEQKEAFFEAMANAQVELRTEQPNGESNSICTCSCPKCK